MTIPRESAMSSVGLVSNADPNFERPEPGSSPII